MDAPSKTFGASIPLSTLKSLRRQYQPTPAPANL